ncbi:MAG: ArsR/SmtB family transcription factor [Shimia sp.]
MDAIFKALSDPARRAILDALRRRDGQTTSEIETLFEMSRFGVMNHLSVLIDAGLVTAVKRGRFKHHYLNALPLQETVDRWLEPLRVAPAARGLADLKARLEGRTKARSLLYVAAPVDAVRAAVARWEGAPIRILAAPVGPGATRLVVHHPETPDDAWERRLAALKTTLETGRETAFPAPDLPPSPEETNDAGHRANG